MKIMQEHHPYNMTPDQGWSKMSSLLKEAMPVERRSRRFIVFWWTAAAVVTAALISVFALMDKQGSSSQSMTAQQNTELNTTPVPETQLQKPDFHQQDIPKSLTINSPEQFKDENKSIAAYNPTIDKNKSEKKEITNHSTIATNTNEQKEITSNSSIAQNTNEREETPDIVPSKTSGQPAIDVEIADHQQSIPDDLPGIDPSETQINIPLADRNNPSLDFLPSVWASDLEFPSIHVNAMENTLACCTPKKKLITPHLGIGGVLGFTKGAGVQSGGGIDINLTERLSVSTDLGYSIYNPDATVLGGFSADSDLESDAILRDALGYEGIGFYLPAEEVGNASGSVISHFVRTIRQWQFSTGLKYDISGKFFAQGGLTLGFGTNSRSTHPVVTNDFIGNPATGNSLKVTNSLDDYNVVRSNTTSVYGGIGYRPCARTEIFAQWTHGLDSYLINDPTPLNVDSKRTDYIRGINMGLRYTL